MDFLGDRPEISCNENDYFGMFDDNENEPMARFHKYSDIEILQNKIKCCEEDKYSYFSLSGNSILEIPEQILSFTWITNLTINNTSIKYITNLPPNLEELVVTNNCIQMLDGNALPSTLTKLIFTNNSLFDIINLKEGLNEIVLNYINNFV